MSYDVVVIGSGHAGCEAALAAARIGRRTLMIAPNIDRVGYMPCNPSIGGPGKSQIVAEIDALGGVIAEVADATAMQVRELNVSKGPAVRAIRIQCDKSLYSIAMKERIELQHNLDLLQDEAIGLRIDPDSGRSRVTGIECRITGSISTSAVVITAGTFLRAKMIAGESNVAGGRAGEFADTHLAGSIADIGFRLRRFKTGTPPRIDSRTVNFDHFEPQPGDDRALWLSRNGLQGNIEPLRIQPSPSGVFSAVDALGGRQQVRCFQASTNARTHAVIRANLDRAPMYNGSIAGTGPRYCPSIEDKVGRYQDKDAHPIFLEPEGWRSHELYIQGMSTSLPPDIQTAALHTIPGLESARITRFGYAVEYDALDPTELSSTLESTRISGLFFAGQVNGTSGYEEAAGQGIVAGANAARLPFGLTALALRRNDAYIGVMVDDLVTKSFTEPYRMLTSRAEFRLTLRSDTADQRLAPIASALGLIDRERFTDVQRESATIKRIVEELSSIWLGANSRHQAALVAAGLETANRSLTALDIARRPRSSLSSVFEALETLELWSPAEVSADDLDRAEIAIRYGAFIEKEQREVERIAASEGHELPQDLNYQDVQGLRLEAKASLARSRPETIGQASRLAGVTPTDVGALLVCLRRLDEADRDAVRPSRNQFLSAVGGLPGRDRVDSGAQGRSLIED